MLAKLLLQEWLAQYQVHWQQQELGLRVRLLVALIFCMALVFPCFGVEIPNWLAALMLIPMIIPVYKFIQVCPWALFDEEEEEE